MKCDFDGIGAGQRYCRRKTVEHEVAPRQAVGRCRRGSQRKSYFSIIYTQPMARTPLRRWRRGQTGQKALLIGDNGSLLLFTSLRLMRGVLSTPVKQLCNDVSTMQENSSMTAARVFIGPKQALGLCSRR